MLRYLNWGPRQYDQRQPLPTRRANWEFQAVLEGRCAPVQQRDEEVPFHEQRLWVFPPGHVHDWLNPPGESCRVVVAHFDRVPEAMQARGQLAVDLSDEQAAEVERVVMGLEPDYRKPTSLSPLRYDRALLGLVLIALSGEREYATDYQGQKVAQAVSWYLEQMNGKPTVDDLARAVSVSTSHLRRLFAKAGEPSPLEVMKRLQLDRARRLMESTAWSISEVADACGFNSASDFSRVFKQREGLSPSQWRAQFDQRIEQAGPR